MNPTYFGDSYDLVKRFFCAELMSLGYTVAIDPMLTGNWNGTEQDFYRLVGAKPAGKAPFDVKPRALLLDPDTGVQRSDGRQHVSFARLAKEAQEFDLVFSFDQSFSRQKKAFSVMSEKLIALRGSAAMPCTTIPMLDFSLRRSRSKE